MPGTRFSGYEIESRLAVGGMAEVWRAKINGLEGFEKRIVIKTMLTNLHHRPDLTEMFVSEASLAARLSHPNIVDVLDFGQLEGRYFIAMEYVPGLTLRVAHKRMMAAGGRLPIVATLHILRDVCEALQHMHELADSSGPLGLLHRDLSPDNVILSTSGTAKLIDFGAARATARTPPGRLFVGKYRYAAPERIRHEGEDCRSDVYSAGVILYECLVGKRPFEGSDAEVIKAATLEPRLRPPPEGADASGLRRGAREAGDRAKTRTIGSRAPASSGRRSAVCLSELGASSKERDVTAALSALLESTSGAATPAPAVADRRGRTRRDRGLHPLIRGSRSTRWRSSKPRDRCRSWRSCHWGSCRGPSKTKPACLPPAEAFPTGDRPTVRSRQSPSRRRSLTRSIGSEERPDGGTSVVGWRRRRRRRPKRTPSSSPPCTFSITGSSCGPRADMAKPSTPGRRRWPSRPRTVSINPTSGDCARNSPPFARARTTTDVVATNRRSL